MTQKPDIRLGPSAAKPRWKPPIWLLVLDTFSLLLLGLGLWLHVAPQSGLAQALPAATKWPLLVVGGLLFVFCWLALVRSMLAARRTG
jgi:hypothetical protein